MRLSGPIVYMAYIKPLVSGNNWYSTPGDDGYSEEKVFRTLLPAEERRFSG
jgi:hypothetical protein